MPALIQLPAAKVLIYGEATRVDMKVGDNATLAKMIPGALVILDTNEGEVKEAGAAAHGILGIIDVNHKHTIGDPYDDGPGALGINEDIPILIPNQGSFVALIMLGNEDLIQGDTLVSAANGLVAEIAAAALGSQGDIIGTAWDTCSEATDTRVIVRWSLCPEGAAII